MRGVSLTVVILLAGSAPALAKPEAPPGLQDIEVGTTRVGGPGTETERRAAAAADAAMLQEEKDLMVTEDTLPPKGHPKRMPGLHVIARRYARGKAWVDACERYDQILEEGGDEALMSAADGKDLASRAYLECGQIAFFGSSFEKAEKLLKKSEKYGPSDFRHASIRRKIKKEEMRKRMGAGDVEGALQIFDQYQAEKADEDERIWMGEQLARLAWDHYRAKDKIQLERTLAQAERVAPKNPELRALQEKIHEEQAVFSRVIVIGAIALAIAFLGSKVAQWRRAQKIKQLAGGGLIEEEEGL